MATYVLIHGGGHGGWCWKPVARQLRAEGHEVFAPTLTGLGERSHLRVQGLGLDTHIEDVVQVLHYEDLSDAILVGHSYGGTVITGAADRAIERVGQLVYLDAAIPHHGEALVDVSPGLLKLAGDTRVEDGIEWGLWPDEAAAAIYGLRGCELESWALQRLSPHPWKTVTDRLRLLNPEQLAALPRTIVNCPASLSARPQATRERWLKADRVWSIDTGHDLMLTEPDAVASMLARLAG